MSNKSRWPGGKAAQIWVAPLSPVQTHQTDCLSCSVHIIVIGPVIITRLNRGREAKDPWKRLRKTGFFSYIKLPFSICFFLPHFKVQDCHCSLHPLQPLASGPDVEFLLCSSPLNHSLAARRLMRDECGAPFLGFITAERPCLFSSLSTAEWYKSTARTALISNPGRSPERAPVLVHLSFSWVLDNVGCGKNQSRPFFPW